MLVSTGSYSVPENVSASTRWSEAQCPPGYYCANGVRSPCPPGSYGATPGLLTASCSGACAAGYFCPSNSTSPTQRQCGVDVVVPCTNGSSNGTGPCIGDPASVYCPGGGGSPLFADAGTYTAGATEWTMNRSLPCDSGSYCTGGVMYPCPPGRFGCADRLGSEECNGPCAAGFYCPVGSLTSQARPCGGNASNVDAATYYCPEGVGAPLRVGVGNYSVGSGLDAPHVRTGQAVCPQGSYCVMGLQVCE